MQAKATMLMETKARDAAELIKATISMKINSLYFKATICMKINGLSSNGRSDLETYDAPKTALLGSPDGFDRLLEARWQ